MTKYALRLTGENEDANLAAAAVQFHRGVSQHMTEEDAIRHQASLKAQKIDCEIIVIEAAKPEAAEGDVEDANPDEDEYEDEDEDER